MSQRYDPDGNPKRRAVAGERECGACDDFREGLWSPNRYCDFRTQKLARPWAFGPGLRRCRADDYAGDCRHFKAREVAR